MAKPETAPHQHNSDTNSSSQKQVAGDGYIYSKWAEKADQELIAPPSAPTLPILYYDNFSIAYSPSPLRREFKALWMSLSHL
jgi:hypothetical protein